MGRAYETFTEKLRAGGWKTRAEGRDRLRAQCPAHGGDDLNLSVAVGDQGVLLKCQSHDCPAADIASAVGMKLTDLFDEDGKATYIYDGGHKVTRQRTRDGKKILQQNKPAVTHLYRHPMSIPLEESDRVILVEGEKCVDAALRLGEPCVTTWPGGVAGIGAVDLSPLQGKKIIIIADNDKPGLQAAAKLTTRLMGMADVQGTWWFRVTSRASMTCGYAAAISQNWSTPSCLSTPTLRRSTTRPLGRWRSARSARWRRRRRSSCGRR